MLIAVYTIIDNLLPRQLFKQLSCTIDLRLFNWLQIQRFHSSFCLRYKENMFHCALMKSYRPVRRIIANRYWNRKPFGAASSSGTSMINFSLNVTPMSTRMPSTDRWANPLTGCRTSCFGRMGMKHHFSEKRQMKRRLLVYCQKPPLLHNLD